MATTIEPQTDITSLLQRPELAEQLSRAQDIVARRIVREQPDGTWSVESQVSDGLLYTVDVEQATCDCEAYLFATTRPCKHYIACLLKSGAITPPTCFVRGCERIADHDGLICTAHLREILPVMRPSYDEFPAHEEGRGRYYADEW